MRHVRIVDLFCGAGGTSTGAVRAIERLGFKAELTAINHWNVAIETHSANHPNARHLCTSLDNINPRDLFRDGELDILLASPECTHHSNARGGRPMNDQSRATAWCVVRWAEAVRPQAIIVENVPEFESWGGIGCNGRPLASKKGATFMAWVSSLESLGYRVDWKILCAADYGDPTTRRRLFVQAVRGRRRIVWPNPSHVKGGESDMLGSRLPYRCARNHVIDWAIKGRWIDEMPPRVRHGGLPLSPNSLRRIHAGFFKHGLRESGSVTEGFLVPEGSARPQSIHEPLGTVLTEDRRSLIEPYLTCLEHGGRVRSIDRPIPTITTAKGGAISLVQPCLIKLRGTSRKQIENHSAASIDGPAPTITANGGHLALIDPYLVQMNHQGGDRTRSVDEPLPVVCGNRGEFALAEPYLIEYYGTGGSQSVDAPLNTVTTKDRHALVCPHVMIDGNLYKVRFRYRMLKAHELAAAQGFPREYQFSGNITQQVKQIGNAVPCGLAEALVGAVLK